MSELKGYIIPVIWKCWGLIEVNAVDLEQAKKLVLETPDLPPGIYIDFSLQIDEESIDIHDD